MLNPEAVERIAALLRSVPLLAGLPQAELAWIAAGLHQHAFPPGALISREGDHSRFFSILLEGEIAVYKSLGQPEERLLTIMQAGEFFGEMSLYEGVDPSGSQRAASLVAHSLAVVLEMPVEAFRSLLNRQPGVAYQVMEVMAARLRSLENATIHALREKNRRLTQALSELQEAQAQLVEKEKLEYELGLARRIQERILPKELPALGGWQLDACWQPARTVSGDFYDFLALPDGRLGVVIGDVSGKGMPAALVMATTCSVLRATARAMTSRRRAARRRTGTTGIFASPFKNIPPYEPTTSGAAAAGDSGVTTPAPAGLSPGQLLAQANDLLCQDMPPGTFAACLFGLLDPASGEFRFANAGHCLPLVLRAQGGVVELRATGMPLGLMPDQEYEDQAAVLAPGDCLVLYSDGLVEAHDPAGGMYGIPRLHQVLAGLGGALTSAAQRSDSLIRALLERLDGFTGPEWEQEDDVTLVTVERSRE